jgi:hypothetical protein
MSEIKTGAFADLNRQILLIDGLLVSARRNESDTNLELWAAYSFEENEDYKNDNIYKSVQQERKGSLLKVPDVISKLDELESALELEMSANYIVNDKEAYTKYIDVITNTFCEHLNVNTERLFKSKYSLLVEDGFLSDNEEEKKTLLLMNLPFRLIDVEKIDSYDLAASFYLTLRTSYERFVNAHNFLLKSRIPNDGDKRVKLESIFKPGCFNICLELFEELDITRDSEVLLKAGKGAATLTAAIDAMKSNLMFNIEKPTYETLFKYFNSYLKTNYSAPTKTGSYGDTLDNANDFLKRNYKR